MTRVNNALVALVTKIQAQREEGQGLAEYGLILALVSIVAITALTLLGGNIADAMDQVAGSI